MEKKIFELVPAGSPNRSFEDLSHTHKFTCNFGELVPTCIIDAVPGAKYKVGGEAITKFQPMVAPPFQMFDTRVEYFIVPKRLLWANFRRYMTEKTVGGNLPVAPYLLIKADGTNWTKMMGHMGIPSPALQAGLATTDVKVSAEPFAALQFIWDEYYRAEYIQTSILQEMRGEEGEYYLVDGDNSDKIAQLAQMRLRAWPHDYFTSCLPNTQYGEAVKIPIGQANNLQVKFNPGAETGDTVTWEGAISPSGTTTVNAVIDESDDPDIPTNQLYVDTSQLTPDEPTIITLRRAYALQRYREKLMRAGTRFTEWLRGIFGTKTSDARLQRPEYIVGVKDRVVISEVLNTTGTAEAPQGTMAGHAMSLMQGQFGEVYVEEPSWIIGLYSCLHEGDYFQGIPKHFLKVNDPLEHFIPDMEHIGEQQVDINEIFAYTESGSDAFGYLPRYTEYKFMNNRISGAFMTDLKFWTAAREFSTIPTLSPDFIKYDRTASDKLFAVEDQVDHLVVNMVHHVHGILPMTKYSTPV